MTQAERPAPRITGAALRFGVLVLLVVGGFLAARYTPLARYLTVERIQSVLASLRGLWWAPAAHVGTILLLGSVGIPATPFIIAGAAIFGALWGTVWNFLGILSASLAGFALARLLGREFVERIGGDKVRKAERLLHRRGFLPLVATRFLPIPFTLVNAAAAVVGVRFWRFLAATAVGLLPSIAVLTYFSAAILGAATGAERGALARQLVVVASAFALLVFLPIGIRRRLRIRRHRRLTTHRAARPRRPR